MDMINNWFSHHVADIGTILLIGAVTYWVGNLLLGKVVTKFLISARHRNWHPKDIEKRQKTLSALFAGVWRILVIVLTGVALFQSIFPDYNLAPLFASAGIIGIALGFGAQSLVKDFLSGLFIISENQYRVGDIIDIEGSSGTVERIGTRSTVLRDADGNVHYFPNGMVMHVINKTMGYSMARFSVAVHPTSDLEEVIEIINTIGLKLASEENWDQKIIEPPAFVSVGEFTATSVDLLIAGKTQPSDQWSVTAQMRRRILLEFEKRHIQLAVAPIFPGQSQKAKK
ncbi:MAG: mechanosensitive ion channel family protein [Candidatus Saccharimonadales bacterium]